MSGLDQSRKAARASRLAQQDAERGDQAPTPAGEPGRDWLSDERTPEEIARDARNAADARVRSSIVRDARGEVDPETGQWRRATWSDDLSSPSGIERLA